MPKVLLIVGLVFAWILSPIFSPAYAAENISIGIANYLPVQGTVRDGDIVAFTNKGYFASKTPYDPFVVGVVTMHPAVSLSLENASANNYPVSSAGRVEMNVSSINGNIQKGDLVTSSQIAGVGMRSSKTGYVVGTAIDSYSSSDKKAVGKITVSLNLHYSYSGSKTISSLTDILNLSILATYESPSAVFKYVVAGIVIVLSALLGFLSFGRAANTGVEALGRNPLAGKLIEFGIVFNVLITIAIIAAGLGIAIFIIRL